MAESTQVAERPDILANAVVTGPNVLPLDPNARAAVPADDVADEAEDTATAPAEAPEPPKPDEGEESQEGDESSDEEEEDEAPPPPKARRKRSFDTRFSELTQQRELARQEAEYWKRRALQTAEDEQRSREQQGQMQQPGIPRRPDGAPIPPVEDEFPTHQDYQAARQLYEEANIEYHVSRALAQERLRNEEAQALRVVRESYADYDEVVRNTPVRLNNDVSAAVLASAQKHQLIYRLATHPDEAMALENVTGPSAYLAIGRLESLVQTASQAAEQARKDALAAEAAADAAAAPPPVSHAPPPIQPTRGNGAPVLRDYDQMSLQEFFEVRNREENRRRR